MRVSGIAQEMGIKIHDNPLRTVQYRTLNKPILDRGQGLNTSHLNLTLWIFTQASKCWRNRVFSNY